MYQFLTFQAFITPYFFIVCYYFLAIAIPFITFYYLKSQKVISKELFFLLFIFTIFFELFLRIITEFFIAFFDMHDYLFIISNQV